LRVAWLFLFCRSIEGQDLLTVWGTHTMFSTPAYRLTATDLGIIGAAVASPH
jgi:hypothetical protein